jgi:hypothetical protein
MTTASVNKPLIKYIESSEIEILDYTPKSIVVKGENTKAIKDTLFEMGGGWNKWLKDNDGNRFSGWVFPKSQLKQVTEYLESIEWTTE